MAIKEKLVAARTCRTCVDPSSIGTGRVSVGVVFAPLAHPVAFNNAGLGIHEENTSGYLPRLPLNQFARFPRPTLKGVRRGLDQLGQRRGRRFDGRRGRGRGRGRGRDGRGWRRCRRWLDGWRGRGLRHGSRHNGQCRSGGRRGSGRRGSGRGGDGATAGERQQRDQRQHRRARTPPHAASIAAHAGGVGAPPDARQCHSRYSSATQPSAPSSVRT